MSRIILLSVLIAVLPLFAKSQCNHPDYAGLMELYNSTGGPNWTNNTGWKEGAAGTNCNPCNGWHGVTCNSNNRVINIALKANNLSGNIPNFSVNFLEKLALITDKITGSIPNFSNLPNLISFDCRNNQLIGSIPNFSNLPKLTNLVCYGNELSGTIPDFTNLPNLVSFSCGYNQLVGEIPDFTNLTNLEYLNLVNNKFSGNFPDLPNSLKELSISRNKFSGPIINIPDSLWYFDCSYNNLSGQIPDYRFLDLYPEVVVETVYFDVSNNQFNGTLPNLYVDSNKVLNFHPNVSFNFSSNDLVGCYPPIFCDYKEISALNFEIKVNNNPKLPWSGNLSNFCLSNANKESQFGAFCDDGNPNTVHDQIYPDCQCRGILDTCIVTIYDTITVRDTIVTYISDTTYLTITETISVTDTLIINLNIPNAPNDPVTNRIIVYPNPASTHVYIDFGDHTLMQNYSCQILNALGQPIFFTPIDQKLYYLDLNTWGGKGTYFIKIINDFGQAVETKKIILQ